MFFEKYEDSYPTLNLVHDCCKHASTFIESPEKYYEDDNFTDDEIMEALDENPFHQRKDDHENLQHGQDCSTMEDEGIFHFDSQHELHEIDQQVEEFHMAQSDERKSVNSDLSIEEDSMQGSLVLIQECDNVKSPISDLDSDCDDRENLVRNPMKENSSFEIISNEEERVTDLTTLISS